MRIQDFFDKGYYINLDRRPDRRKEFEEEMEKHNLHNFFERVSAEDSINELDPMKKHYYCASSFYKLFEKIYDKGYETVVIFEDDAQFYNTDTSCGHDLVEKTLDELQYFTDWDMVYFGGHPRGEVESVSKTLYRVNDILTTHACGYKRRTIKKILDKYVPFQDGAIDGWLSCKTRHITKYITNFPAIIQRQTSNSDLDAYGHTVPPEIFLQNYNSVKKINPYDAV